MDLADLERRLRVLEDIEAIKQLKARYCAYCDANYDADGIASLFTDDAVWEGEGFGRCEGREAIRRFFRGSPSRMPFAIHHVMNPIIEVQGDSATGQWYLFQPLYARHAGGLAGSTVRRTVRATRWGMEISASHRRAGVLHAIRARLGTAALHIGETRVCWTC